MHEELLLVLSARLPLLSSQQHVCELKFRFGPVDRCSRWPFQLHRVFCNFYICGTTHKSDSRLDCPTDLMTTSYLRTPWMTGGAMSQNPVSPLIRINEAIASKQLPNSEWPRHSFMKLKSSIKEKAGWPTFILTAGANENFVCSATSSVAPILRGYELRCRWLAATGISR